MSGSPNINMLQEVKTNAKHQVYIGTPNSARI